MDYHTLKRKQLQALCKKHNIPGNAANSVLADKLSALLNDHPGCTEVLLASTDNKQSKELVKEAEEATESVRVTRSKANDGGVQHEDNKQRKKLVKQAEEATESVRVTRSKADDGGVQCEDNKQSKKLVKEAEEATESVRVTRSKADDGGVQREDNKQSKKLVKEAEEATESVRVPRSKADTVNQPARRNTRKIDYHTLKRKQLLALCKKNNIPGNAASSVLADKLSALLNDHSGCTEVLLASTGKDATDFKDIGHSDDAKAMMDKYYIGDLHKTSQFVLKILLPLFIFTLTLAFAYAKNN